MPFPIANPPRPLAALLLLSVQAVACRTPSPAGMPRPASSPAALPSAGPDARAVEAALRLRIAQVAGAEVGLAVRALESGQALAIRGDPVFHAASTMKVPVLFALYRAFASGALAPDATLRLENRFASIVDGSPYALEASEDSDSLVYTWIGRDVPLRDLARRMITHSSNLATNAVIGRLDAERITALTRELGTTRLLVRRGVEDDKAYAAGLNNTTTANDLVALFTALERGEVGDAAATREMLGILEAQAFNNEIPAGLPAGTRVAHKTGSITATWHDAGLVYPPGRKPYAIAILTRNIPQEAVANRLMADCSRIIWRWLVEGR